MESGTKVVAFSAPPEVVAEFEKIRREEGRGKSELFREMFRVYKQVRDQRNNQVLILDESTLSASPLPRKVNT